MSSMDKSTIEASHEADDTRTLYEAAKRGCIATFNTIIQRDEFILHKLSLTNFTQTPLHISSLLGHLDFSISILERYPKMASEFDSGGRSPLHLASAEGHTEIVKALLCVNKDACFARDQDCIIPLHLATMRGRDEAIKELVRARPESISELLEGDTVLHLCVKYYHLEALKLLVDMARDIDVELIKKQNPIGNTILHLAAMLKQSETIKYITLELGEKAIMNTKNKSGFTALQILELFPKDIKSYEIRELLTESDQRKEQKPNNQLSVNETVVKKWMRKFKEHLEYQSNWTEQTRGSLMTVATLIAAMSFQTMVNPPGGVWQQDYRDNSTNSMCDSENNQCVAGTSVFGYYWPQKDYFKMFLICNCVAFLGSLMVIFLVIGGFPLQNKICVWLMTVTMCTTIVFTGLTYFISMYQITPDKFLYEMDWSESAWQYVWGGLVLLVSLLHIMRFMVWIKKKHKNRQKNRLDIDKLKKLRVEEQNV